MMTLAAVNTNLEVFVTALKNHLWQSTLFAFGVAALSLALRNNPARARYGIWLAASLKFLIPLWPLICLGTLLPPPHHADASRGPVYFVMDEVSQPFTGTPVQQTGPIAPISSHAHQSVNLPLLIGVVWATGCFTIGAVWFVSWRRVWIALRKATPITSGRELQMLREVEQNLGISTEILMVSSPSAFGPAVYGIHRPVLIWPSNLSPLLEDAQLQAILTHEVCHVRRRDNLTAILHMFVQAVVWFHPMVWWLGSRLELERERACDEDVLKFVDRPYTYAQSILKVCEYCLESPLPCISGVTGAALQRRIRDIMTGRVMVKLSLDQKLLIGGAVVSAVLVPILSGEAAQTRSAVSASSSNSSAVSKSDANATGSPRPRFEDFEVATIKPVESKAQTSRFIALQGLNRFVAKNYTLKLLIAAAYNLNPKAISGGPEWIDSAHYDLLALSPGNVRPTHDEQMAMLRSLLTDRFGLTFHREPKEFSIYALEVAKGGPKLKATVQSLDQPPVVGPGVVYPQRIVLPARNATMEDFVSLLQRAIVDRPVVDSTGLSGRYDFDLEWAPDETQFGGEVPAAPSDASSPPLFQALQEELGLRLEPRKGLASAFVIDDATKPTAN